MRAKITHKHGYRCAPDGAVNAHFYEGTVVEGKIAEWAVADGYAVKIEDDETPELETKPASALDTKPAAKRGRK